MTMNEFPICIGRRSGNGVSMALNVVLLILVFVLALELVFFSRFKRFYVVGSSMYPTLIGADDEYSAGGDYVYADIYAAPQRGDIVVITTEKCGDAAAEKKMITIIKRVIAMEGDSVELRAGKLYLNDAPVSEPYVEDACNTPSLDKNNFERVMVPDGCIFVLGDNRDASNDSRGCYGMIESDDVVGVVADWSLALKGAVTAFGSFFDFTVPGIFSGCSGQ